MSTNPLKIYPRPPFNEKPLKAPALTSEMNLTPDHGEDTYQGGEKLKGKKAIITGGDSGIGRAVAIAFAREGADVLISYLSEVEDAESISELIKKEGRKAVLVKGDISSATHCRHIVDMAVTKLGGIDILVNNAAFQQARDSIQEISTEEWDYTFRVDNGAMFYLVQASEEHLKPGSSIINTTSVNAYNPSPYLLPYAASKGAIKNFTSNLAQIFAEKGIRVNSVAPGPVWTPLIPATMPMKKVNGFGENTPLKRPAQPAELAPSYVFLASDEASYITGATLEVTGGRTTI